MYLLPLLVMGAAFLCSSCKRKKTDVELRAIGFNVETVTTTADGTSAPRRAGRTGRPLQDEGIREFHVFGYKHMDEAQTEANRQTVLNDYTVHYTAGSANTTESNTHGWEYVGYGEGGGQSIKYWDYSAKAYRFYGYVVPEGKTCTVTHEAERDVLTYGGAFQLADFGKPLYSRLNMKSATSPTQIGTYVQLEFCYGVAMVELRFYMNEDPLGDVSLSDIVFAPVATTPATTIPTGVSAVEVIYPTAGAATEESATITADENSATALTFDNLTLLRESYGTPKSAQPNIANCYSSTVYCLLPQTNPAYTLSLKLNGVTKTATVPDTYMSWKGNHKYTYLFKLSPDLDIVLEAVTVDEWKVYDHRTTVDTW